MNLFPLNTERPSYAPPPAPAPTTVSVSEHVSHPFKCLAPSLSAPTLKHSGVFGQDCGTVMDTFSRGWPGNLCPIEFILENRSNIHVRQTTNWGFYFNVLFFAAFCFIPSHQICLFHPHSVCVALLQMDVEQMPVCAAIKNFCFLTFDLVILFCMS